MSERELQEAQEHVKSAVRLIRKAVEAQDLEGIFPSLVAVDLSCLFEFDRLREEYQNKIKRGGEEVSAALTCLSGAYRVCGFPGEGCYEKEKKSCLFLGRDGDDLIVMDEERAFYRRRIWGSGLLEPVDDYGILEFGRKAILSEERKKELRKATQVVQDFINLHEIS